MGHVLARAACFAVTALWAREWFGLGPGAALADSHAPGCMPRPAGPWISGDQLHPAANWLRKQVKSRMLRVGGVVEWSQLA